MRQQVLIKVRNFAVFKNFSSTKKFTGFGNGCPEGWIHDAKEIFLYIDHNIPHVCNDGNRGCNNHTILCRCSERWLCGCMVWARIYPDQESCGTSGKLWNLRKLCQINGNYRVKPV